MGTKKTVRSRAKAELDALLGGGTKIEVVTPQFERPPNEPPPLAVPVDFAELPKLSDDYLQTLGMRRWGREHEDTETGPMLWLFPGEWYDKIPEGLEIVDIFFNKETFRRGRTDNDIRYGCLAFGIVKQ